MKLRCLSLVALSLAFSCNSWDPAGARERELREPDYFGYSMKRNDAFGPDQRPDGKDYFYRDLFYPHYYHHYREVLRHTHGLGYSPFPGHGHSEPGLGLHLYAPGSFAYAVGCARPGLYGGCRGRGGHGGDAHRCH